MKTQTTKKFVFLSANAVLVLSLLFSQSCARDWTVEPLRVDQNFGNTVSRVSAAQIYDKEQAGNPRSEPVKRLDGMVGEGGLADDRSIG